MWNALVRIWHAIGEIWDNIKDSNALPIYVFVGVLAILGIVGLIRFWPTHPDVPCQATGVQPCPEQPGK